MAKPRLIVDVDQVVVDTQRAWHHDLELTTKLGKHWEEVCHLYDLIPVYKEELLKRNVSGMAFWKQPNLYCDLEPIKDSVTILDWASDYFDIVFVSVIKGGHGSSKADFLKKYFPFQKGIVFTKEKYLIDGDCIIDDRFENLNNHPASLKIFYDAGYEQNVDSNCTYQRALNWIEVRDILSEEYI